MENDFRLSICSDNWSEMDMNEYVTNQYRERYMGLISDNSDSINYAYTAVFPSKIVLEKIIADYDLVFALVALPSYTALVSDSCSTGQDFAITPRGAHLGRRYAVGYEYLRSGLPPVRFMPCSAH